MKGILALFVFVGVTLPVFAVKQSRFKELELLNSALYLIESQYYREVDTKKLIEGAIKGMMDTLDPHSAYLNKEFFKKMQNDTNGEFGGLGIEVTQKDGVIYVVTPIDDTPAYRAGVKPKDKIVEINHESILGFTLDEAIDRMKGKEGSKIHLGIVREGIKGIKHFTLKREKIIVKPVKSFLVADEYAFVRLTQFQRRSSSEINKALKRLNKKTKNGLKGAILDLRSNPGGLLDEAVKVSSLFLDDGVVVSTESRDPNNKNIHYVIKSIDKYPNLPLVVLVNGASASASEIVAGALQDHKRGIIMGSQTFGKGSVQSVISIDKSNENGLKLTIAQYMTPKGRKIQALGITPDIHVEEVSSDWYEEHLSNTDYIREKDLRNHLTATKETAEEKERRLAEEKVERSERAKKIKNRGKKSKKDDIFTKYDPNRDYQVSQAIKVLKTYQFIDQREKVQK